MWAITGAHAGDTEKYNHSHNARRIPKDSGIRMKADLRKSSHCPDYERKRVMKFLIAAATENEDIVKIMLKQK